MAQVPQSLTKEGVYGVPVASGSVVRIDPNLRNGQGQRLGLDEVDVSGAFLCININDDPNLPEYGTFDAQNISDADAELRWSASSHVLLFRKVNATPEATFGPNGADPSPFPPITIAGGGGGGNDIRAPRITIGNAQAGDDATVCNQLWDNTSLVSINAVASTLALLPAGSEVYFRSGEYIIPPTIAGLLVNSGCKVHGAGMRETIFRVGTDPFAAGSNRWNAFTVGSGTNEEAEIANIGILCEYVAASTVLGEAVVLMGDKSTAQNVFIGTPADGLQGGNNVQTECAFGGGGANIRILDCIVDLNVARTNAAYYPNEGVAAVGGETYDSFSDAEIRVQVLRCDAGFAIAGTNNKIKAQMSEIANVGRIIGASQCDVDLDVDLSTTLINTNPALVVANANKVRVRGSMKIDDLGGFDKRGIYFGFDGVGSQPVIDSHIQCDVVGFTTCIETLGACTRNSIQGCYLEMDETNVGNEAVLIGTGATHHTIQGNNIRTYGWGITLEPACAHNTIQGNTILGETDSLIGISLQGTATKNTVVGNTIELPNVASTGIEALAGAGSANQVIANNAITANTLVSNPATATAVNNV